MKERIVNTTALAIMLAFSAGAMAEGMSKADFKAGKDKIELADLDANCKAIENSRYTARVVKAEADFRVAKEKCDAFSGVAKVVDWTRFNYSR